MNEETNCGAELPGQHRVGDSATIAGRQRERTNHVAITNDDLAEERSAMLADVIAAMEGAGATVPPAEVIATILEALAHAGFDFKRAKATTRAAMAEVIADGLRMKVGTLLPRGRQSIGMLRRRAEFLRAELAEAGDERLSSWDHAELTALDYAIALLDPRGTIPMHRATRDRER